MSAVMQQKSQPLLRWAPNICQELFTYLGKGIIDE